MAWLSLMLGSLLMLGEVRGGAYGLAMPIIFIAWGITGFLRKKYNVKDDGYFIYAMFLIGLSVFGYFEMLGNPEYEQENLLPTAIILFLGGALFALNGLKKHLAKSKSNDEY